MIPFTQPILNRLLLERGTNVADQFCSITMWNTANASKTLTLWRVGHFGEILKLEILKLKYKNWNIKIEMVDSCNESSHQHKKYKFFYSFSDIYVIGFIIFNFWRFCLYQSALKRADIIHLFPQFASSIMKDFLEDDVRMITSLIRSYNQILYYYIRSYISTYL